MKKLLAAIVSASMLCIGIIGCKSIKQQQQEPKTTNTYVVVVGMENSKFAGSCPGAGYDADRMYKLLSSYTPNIVLFRDSNATKANVVAALTKAVEKAQEGLLIFCYSGHGGSEPFPNTGIEEEDGKDEFLCLWDTYMKDNEIWDIISKSRGRIMLIVDACHSQSIMRNSGFRLKVPLSWDHEMSSDCMFSLLCWSGCPDNAYSYGSVSGGQLTNALLRHYNHQETYQDLWNKIKNDKTLRAYENPQSTNLGKGFINKMVFK